jgi:hypothetical protein
MEVLGEKPGPVPLCLPHISHGLVWDGARASDVRCRRPDREVLSLSESYAKHCYHYCENKMFGSKNVSGDLYSKIFETSVALEMIIYAYNNAARIHRSVKSVKAARE